MEINKIYFLKYTVIFITFFVLGCSSPLGSETQIFDTPSSTTKLNTLIFSNISQTAIAGVILTPALTVDILDTHGDPVLASSADSWAPITLSLYSGEGHLLGTNTTFSILGRATFTNLKFDLSGHKRLKAFKPDFSLYGGSGSASVISSQISVTASGPVGFSISGADSTSPNSCNAYLVNSIDAFGNTTLASQTTTFNISSNLHGMFYSDNLCQNSTSQTTVLANSNSSTFYYQNLGQEVDRIHIQTSDNSVSNFKDVSLSELNIKQFYASSTTYCLLYTNGTAQCTQTVPSITTGPNFSLQSKIFKLERPITDLSIGYDHICAIDDSAQLFCWGGNQFGQIGNGNTLNQYLPTHVTIGGNTLNVSAGHGYTCATISISSNHIVKCWGANTNSRLGNDKNTTAQSLTPLAIDYTIPAGVTVNKLKTYDYTFAILSTGKILYWGGVGAYSSTQPKINSIINNAIDIIIAGYNWILFSDGSIGYNVNFDSQNPVTIYSYNFQKFSVANSGNQAKICGINSSQNIICLASFGLPLISGEPYSSLYKNQLPDRLLTSELVTYNNQICTVESNSKNIVCWLKDNQQYVINLDINKSFQNLKLSATQNLYSIDNNQCIELKIENQNNHNLRPMNENILISLSEPNSSGLFYSDSGCNIAINNITLYALQTEQKLYFKGFNNTEHPKIITLIASSHNASVSSAQLKMKYYGNPYQKSFVSLSDSISDNTSLCISATIEFKDLDNTTRPLTSSTHLDISTAVDNDFSTAQFLSYSDSNCTTPLTQIDLPAGTSQFKHYVKKYLTDICYVSVYTYSIKYNSTPNLNGELKYDTSLDCTP